MGDKGPKEDSHMLGNLAKLATAIKKADLPTKQSLFVERRTEPRLWCSDLVQVWIKDMERNRWVRKGTAVLEDISRSGACVQLESPVASSTLIRVKHPQWKVEGEVRYCMYRDDGYFVGVQLAEAFRWTKADFEPQHLMDPQKIPKKKK